MKKIFYKHAILITISFLITVSGIIYSFNAPPMYSSTSHVAIFRPNIENPDVGSEESRNRWIWIRDGLNLKSAIVTDTLLKTVLNTNEKLNIDYLKTLINIQFTGADENNYIIEVKAPTPILAYQLNSMLFNRVRYLAIDANQDKFNGILSELQKKQEEYKTDENTYSFYQDKIKKMIFDHTLEQKQRENTFEVIKYPNLNETPQASRANYIIVSSIIIGLVLGLFGEYLYYNYQSKE